MSPYLHRDLDHCLGAAMEASGSMMVRRNPVESLHSGTSRAVDRPVSDKAI